MFLKEKLIKHIIIEINILNKNKVIELKFINKDIMLIPPIKAPSNNLINLTFLFKIYDTQKSKIKSKKKLSNTIKSMYIFIYLSPIKIYKKDIKYNV